MGLINLHIPNLLGGISQQPPEVRTANQLEDVVNMLPHPVRGLERRPSTDFVYSWGNYSGSKPFFFTHLRTNSDLYDLIVARENGVTNVKIVDSLGSVAVLHRDNDILWHYLNSETPHLDYQAVSVGDHIYLVNKTKVVAKHTDRTARRVPEAIVAFKMTNYATTYTISVTKGYTTKTVQLTTMSSTQNDTAWAQLAERSTAMGYILNHVNQKFNNIASTADPNTGWDMTAVGLPTNMGCQIEGSTLYFYNTNGDYTDFTVSATDTAAGEHLRAYKDSTDKYEDLPTETHSGFEIKISSTNNKDEDDYYVRSYGDRWKECGIQNDQNRIDPLTLPIQFRLDDNGEWWMEHISFASRNVGDDTTNPFPAFVGEAIRHLVGIYKERLVIVSKSAVQLSRIGSFGEYDFFRTTVLTTLDTDPISVELNSYNRSAVPFANSLMVFTDSGEQFKLVSNGPLTPTSITVSSATSFDTGQALPVASGKIVLFSIQKGEYGQLWEFFTDSATTAYINTLDAATELSAHVPELLRGTVQSLTLSTNNGLCFVKMDTDDGKVYAYKFLFDGDKKVMSAWTVLDFGDTVYNIQAMGDTVKLLVLREGKMYLEKMSLTENRSYADTGYNFHLDQRVALSTASGLTALPYTTSKEVVYIAPNGTRIEQPDVADLLADGQVVYAGTQFESSVTMSRPKVADDSNQAFLTGKLQVKTYTIAHYKTGYFRLVKNGRPTKEFNGRYLNAPYNESDMMPIITGTTRFTTTGKSTKLTVQFVNDTHLPFAITSAEVEGYFTTRSQRM